MNPNDPNVVMQEMVARHRRDGLRRELVFVGGAVAGLLIELLDRLGKLAKLEPGATP